MCVLAHSESEKHDCDHKGVSCVVIFRFEFQLQKTLSAEFEEDDIGRRRNERKFHSLTLVGIGIRWAGGETVEVYEFIING